MKRFISILSFAFLLGGLVGCAQENNTNENVDAIEDSLPEAKGDLQKIFASLRNNNFSLSYNDSYAAQGVSRSQTSKYTSYSLESSGDLGFNGYAQNDECVFSYNIVDNQIVSGTPVIDTNKGLMVTNIYDYRDGLNEFDYTFLPSDYKSGEVYEYKFGENAKNDELIVSVFLRMTYNPEGVPNKLTMQVVGNQLKIDTINRYYELQNAYDTVQVVAYDIGTTENSLIKKYLEDGKSSKKPLDNNFFYLIAPYLESNNFKTTLDARELRTDSGSFETFYEDQYFLNDAIVYDNKSTGLPETISGDLQIPGTVVNFTLDSLNDEELTITATPYNPNTEDFYYSLYGEYLDYSMSSLSFSNFVGYIDEENENSYYITDSQTQSILSYICKYEIDTTSVSLKSLRMEVTNWEEHEFTLYFSIYDKTTNLDKGVYKVSFSNVGEVDIPAVRKYLNYGDDASTQSKDDFTTVMNKFKNNNYSMDVLTGAGVAKAYYTENYFYEEVYGAPANNYGFIKEGDAIYEFVLTYDANNNISGISIDRSKDYAASYGMTLPGCGSYLGGNDDLFYFSSFDDAIYNYDSYTQDSILGYSYWKNTTTYDDNRITFSNAVLKYFYPNDTSGALPQGAGFIVSNGDNPYDTRVSLMLAYSSSDGLNYGGQLTTFYDIGGTGFAYLDEYIDTLGA